MFLPLQKNEMKPMRIAAISDVHGNSWALAKVLKSIESKKPDLIINLGDTLYGPLNPRETYNMVRSHGIISISGNEDRLITEHIGKKSKNSTIDFVIKELHDEALDWLTNLPKTAVLDCRVFMCHGTPLSDSTYLLERLTKNHVSVHEPVTIDELLKSVVQTVVFCGHSHIHRVVKSYNHMVINPGSAGCPAFSDDFPVHHKIENYSSHAQYCLSEINSDGILVEQVCVPYDVHAAVDCAIRNNRPDWAQWLKTGRVI
jgi:predicted phosphodiesterase